MKLAGKIQNFGDTDWKEITIELPDAPGKILQERNISIEIVQYPKQEISTVFLKNKDGEDEQSISFNPALKDGYKNAFKVLISRMKDPNEIKDPS